MRKMHLKLLAGWLMATAVFLTGTKPAQAQVADYAVPGNPSINAPLPTGNPGGHGVFVTGEFLMLTQTRALGDQTIAVRGLLDSRGLITGLPGGLIGSGREALSTRDLPRRSWNPGFTVGIGYKFDDGTSVYGNYSHIMSHSSHAGASLVPPFFRGSADLSDTFLTSGVFNFPPQYAGPNVKTTLDDTNGDGVIDAGEGGNFYGIWNGASVMDLQFDQWFNQAEIGARIPLFQTEYSRIYGLAGGRFNMFMERLKWRTVSYDINGVAGPRDAALYSNTLSQRMYGPFIGCGHEAYIGKSIGVSLDVTAAALLNVVKQRAKYELQSQEIQNKLSRDEFGIVPSFTANLNVTWYPLEGVQLRAGYNAWTFFNTMYMNEPVGFNYGSLDPAYDTKVFRIIHGVNVGLGIFF
jgi:hypothetical protein